MHVRRTRVRWSIAVAAVMGLTVPFLAAASAGGATILNRAHRGASGPKILATDISGNGSATTTGEPEIAQNPLNPNDLFIDWTTIALSSTTTVANPCGGASSTNGGLSWQPATLPLTGCADATAAYGPDGTLYAGGIITTSVVDVGPPPCPPDVFQEGPICIEINAYDGIVRSTDGGQTWTTTPTKIMGGASEGPFPFAPGSGDPVGTFDRPFLSVDESTNTLYAVGHNVVDHEGFVTASTNDGRSFGTIYAIDSPAYPQGGNFGGTIAAAHGTLAVAYTAASAPGATCPCVIFETSRDDGATFSRHVVPTVNAATDPQPFIAADPAHHGQFALTIFDSTGTQNQVYTTDDFGRHWHGPTMVSETQTFQNFKPWISYGPQGQLALVWRTWLGPPNTSEPGAPDTGPSGSTPYAVWAAVSTSRGGFSAPLQISLPAPYPPGYTFGDDFSWVIADSKHVYVGWGDGRDIPVGGGTQTWLARVPYETFQGSNGPGR
jgi:hypothetical protein